MHTRRDFLGSTGSALAGLVFVGCDLMSAPGASAQPGRREVVVNGKRAKTVDIHAHCAVPEALALMNLKLQGPGLRPDLDMESAVDLRLKAMDAQGIDMEALSINPNWYKVERDLAEKIISIQNEKLAEACAKHPDRFVAFATVALQFPIWLSSSSSRASRSMVCAGPLSEGVSLASKSAIRSSTPSGPRPKNSVCSSSFTRNPTGPPISCSSG